MKLELRPWSLADAPSLARHADNKNVSRYLRDHFPYPYTQADATAFITMAMNEAAKEKGNGLFAIDIDGEAVGGIGYHRQTDVYRYNAEVGYWLGQEHWGKGVMTASLRRFVDMVFTETDLVRLFAGTFAPNQDSQKVLENNGFVREAHHIGNVVKDGVFLDSFMYALRREQWETMRANDLSVFRSSEDVEKKT
ncbi:MAG: GNAT family N-acetyltransferase [Candidatus Kapaibacterium sp.]